MQRKLNFDSFLSALFFSSTNFFSFFLPLLIFSLLVLFSFAFSISLHLLSSLSQEYSFDLDLVLSMISVIDETDVSVRTICSCKSCSKFYIPIGQFILATSYVKSEIRNIVNEIIPTKTFSCMNLLFFKKLGLS